MKGRSIGGQLRFLQLDQVAGLSARTIKALANPFRRTVGNICDGEADVGPERCRLRLRIARGAKHIEKIARRFRLV